MNDVFRSMFDPQAGELLAQGGHAPFFFATPEHTLLAQGGCSAVPSATSLTELSQVVKRALHQAQEQGHPHPVVVGAIPFDTRLPASLAIPQKVLWGGPLTQASDEPPRRPLRYRVGAEPAAHDYANAVAEAVRRIRAGELDKVVLARTLAIDSEQEIDVQHLLARLTHRNAHGYTFAVQLAGHEGTLVGASPELLVRRQGLQVRSNPLAGSAARAADAQEDLRRSLALLDSAKDLHEHQVVAQAVANGMRPHCRTLDAPATPALLHTATMWHLSSDIRGELHFAHTSTLDLAASLHPTPAVCGYPDEAARQLIGQLEPFARGYYTGMVGWCDAEGNGEWVVTLRCAQVQGTHMRLYAGAGVVADSDPQSEVAETAAKFRTMLNALGLALEGPL